MPFVLITQSEWNALVTTINRIDRNVSKLMNQGVVEMTDLTTITAAITDLSRPTRLSKPVPLP